jgi:Clr5 domain
MPHSLPLEIATAHLLSVGAAIDMAPARQDPSPKEWDDARNTIYNLYIARNMTARSVAKVMANTYNFHASVRMYKDRFKKWEIDCKTIRQPVWEQMAEIYAFRRDYEHKDTVFEVTVGGVRKTVGFKQIDKHFMRVDPGKPSTIDKATFDKLVQRSQLTFSTRPSSPIPNTQHMHDGNEASNQGIRGNISPFGSASAPVQTSESSRAASSGPEYTEYEQWRVLPRTVLHSALQPELDLPDILALLTIERHCNDTVKSRVESYAGFPFPQKPSRRLTSNELKAGSWVTNCFLTCIFHNQNEMEMAQEHRQSAMEVFREMLRTGNQQVLPGLLWITSIMNAHGDDDLLKQFLQDSFEVNKRSANSNPIYDTVFGYCLAVLKDNDLEIEGYGSQLCLGEASFALIWGEDSPNVLVRRYYWAWHLLRKKKYAEAIELMQESLSKTERVMGRYHHITVNCLAIQSRAYAEQNQDSQAISLLSDAVQRSLDSWGSQNPFRLDLLRRLAMLQKKVFNLSEAERIMREVVDGRTCLFGLSKGSTWRAIYDLIDILKQCGKLEEAHSLHTSMHERLQRERSSVVPRWAYSSQLRSEGHHGPD